MRNPKLAHILVPLILYLCSRGVGLRSLVKLPCHCITHLLSVIQPDKTLLMYYSAMIPHC